MFARACSTTAWLLATDARAASSVACAWFTLIWKGAGSMRAMSCPFVTRVLKSAKSAWMLPETWDPT